MLQDFDIPSPFLIKMATLMSEITMLILIILFNLTKQTHHKMSDISEYYFLDTFIKKKRSRLLGSMALFPFLQQIGGDIVIGKGFELHPGALRFLLVVPGLHAHLHFGTLLQQLQLHFRFIPSVSCKKKYY